MKCSYCKDKVKNKIETEMGIFCSKECANEVSQIDFSSKEDFNDFWENK